MITLWITWTFCPRERKSNHVSHYSCFLFFGYAFGQRVREARISHDLDSGKGKPFTAHTKISAVEIPGTPGYVWELGVG